MTLTNTDRLRLDEVKARSLKWQRGEESDSPEQLQHNIFFLLLVIEKLLGSSMSNSVQWIELSAQKPTDYGWYLVVAQKQDNLGLSRWIETASWGNHFAYGDTWFDYTPGSTVTHWAELPQFPSTEPKQPNQIISTGRLMGSENTEGDRNG